MKWPSRKRIPHPFAITLVNDADTIYINHTHRRYFPLPDQGPSAWEQLYFVHVLGKHSHQSDIPQSGVDRVLRSIYRGVPTLSAHRTRLTDRWNMWKIHQGTFIYYQNKVRTSSKSYIAMLVESIIFFRFSMITVDGRYLKLSQVTLTFYSLR